MTTTYATNRFTTLLAQAFREKQHADPLSTSWFWDAEQGYALEAISGALLACLAILEALQCDADYPEAIGAILKDLSLGEDLAHRSLGRAPTMKSYGENVAAIAARVHQDKAVYQEIYEHLPEETGGFVGIWGMCALAAEIFSHEESRYIAGEDFDWVEAIEAYAARITSSLRGGTAPTVQEMHRMAAGAIDNSLIKH